MIGRVIDWSARNIVPVLIATLFAVAGGIYALKHLPLDAIPDLSDTQVIVYTTYPGQAPQVVEDQVTYPLTTAMLTVPKSKVVRGFSFFGVSFVYVIFEEGTDIYWARSRVLEYLNAAATRLPSGITPTLGPDASGVGWVYQYAVTSKTQNLAETRSLKAWPRSRALAASSSNTMSLSMRSGCAILASPSARCVRRSAPATPMWAGAPSSFPNSNSWCAAGATSGASTISARSSSRSTTARPCF
jgi:Cu/Ag efflux pump CusA